MFVSVPAAAAAAAVIVCFFLWKIIQHWLTRKLTRKLGELSGASSIVLRVGWIYVSDVVLEFEEGPFESVSAGQIKLRICKSLVNLLSGDTKMQLLIPDIGVVMRSSTSKATVKVKQLTLNISKDGGTKLDLYAKSILVLLRGESCGTSDHSSSLTSASQPSSSAKKSHKEYQLLAALANCSPEKVSFSLPRLNVRYSCEEHDIIAENLFRGITLTSVKSKTSEGTEEITRLDLQMKLRDIQLHRVEASTILEILEVDVKSSIDIPIQPVLPIRANVQIELKGTRCNLFISRLQQWVDHHILKTRKVVPQGGTHTDMKATMWTCAVSASDMTVMPCGTDNLPVYQFCLQPWHAHTSISSMGTEIKAELGELNLNEYPLGMQPNSGSLMHIAKITLEWKTSDEVGCRSELVLLGLTRMGFDFSSKRFESFITNVVSFKAHFKKLPVAGPSERINLSNPVEKQKKKEYHLDVKKLTISAKLGHGMEVKLEAQSILSENACTGVFLEELMLAFNGSRVLRTRGMRISRSPTASSNLSDAVPVMTSGLWDWEVGGPDVHICMPYKLQLRAIYDSIEEMLRGLILITVAKDKDILPGKRESSKPEKSSPMFGRIGFCIQSLTADIEEEPIQGWLDEHYKLMKKKACELADSLNSFEDYFHKETSDPSDERKMVTEAKEHFKRKEKKKIHKQSFLSYYKSCKRLVPSEGSGACREGFQAGFKPSAARTSILSVCAEDFNFRLKAVHGHDAGLMEVVKQLSVNLTTGCFVVKLRDYRLPLFSASQIVFAQQATPNSDLHIHFEKGEFSFGVGYEPALADISDAFSVALSQRNPVAPQVAKEEQSLPWWDNMRNNVHGNITLSFSESKWVVLATTDPYESQDELRIMTGLIKLQQSDGCVCVDAEDFKIKLSSLESLISRHSLNVPVGTSGDAFIEAPMFNLTVRMDWDCESGNSLNVTDQLRSKSLSLLWKLFFGPGNSQDSPTINLGAHDLAWILKFWGMIYDPPHNLRSFSRWPRFERRVTRPGYSSLNTLMTEFMLHVDVSPSLINYIHWNSDDPARRLTFDMDNLTYKLVYRKECKRDALDLVYQCLDLQMPKAFINKDEHFCISAPYGKDHKRDEKHQDEGFLFSSDSFKMKKQDPKADRSDDDGYQVVIAGLKLLWTLENMDALSSVIGGISKMKTEKSGDRTGKVEEGTTHFFMVNAIDPQFTLQSEKGRFLLAAAGGHVLARHTEISVMLEHVQGHVAPGTGTNWLSRKRKRTRDLESIIMPSNIYLQYKVKPREVTINVRSIKAATTSMKVQVLLDVLSSLLSKPRTEDDDDAMRICLQINKVVWRMLIDGKSFAQAEINDMNYHFHRDCKGIGVTRFTTKDFAVRNCLPNAKSDMLLSAWDPPSEWGRKVMLSLSATQGAPEAEFEVEMCPLKIYWPQGMTDMMRMYFFPEENQDAKDRKTWTIAPHNIDIKQVEVLITYEDYSSWWTLGLLTNRELSIEPVYYANFTGTWRDIFSRLEKHIKRAVVTPTLFKKSKHKATPKSDPLIEIADGFATSIEKLFDSSEL